MKEHFVKNIVSALVIGTLLLANSVAYAGSVTEPGVSYEPEGQQVAVAGNATDLFTSMKSLTPGATAQQVIKLTNNGNEDVKFYLKAVPTEEAKFASKDAQRLSDELLQIMQLEVSVTVPGGQEPVTLYRGDASGNTAQNRTDTGLANAILLGRVGAKGEGVITATLTAPGAKIGNEYKNATAMVDWVFQCELADYSGGGGDPGGGTGGGGGTPDGGDPETLAPDPIVDITNQEVPLAGPPTFAQMPVPGNDETIVDITDGEVPLGAAPDVIIVADGVPLGNLPKTGGLTNYLDEIGLLLLALGAAYIVVRKVEKKKTV